MSFYKKERLSEREWHKFILWYHDHPNLKTRIDTFVSDIVIGEHMHRNGYGWHLLMLDDLRDIAMLKIAFGLRPGEDRGRGDWSKKKYSSAKTNSFN